ncbi:MAG: glycosyltransferase family 4 protein [Pseudomonadota bacterium]
MSFLYIKNGDAARQVSTYKEKVSDGRSVQISGPDSFLFSLLTSIEGQPITVISRSQQAARVDFGQIRGITVSDAGSSIVKVARRVTVAIHTFLMVLSGRYKKVVCGVGGSRLWMAWLASVLRGRPMIASRHNSLLTVEMSLITRLHGAVDRWVLRRVSRVICHGPFLKEELCEYGIRDPIDFEVPLVDFNKINSEEEKSPSDHLRIYYIGRVEREKGLVELVESVVQINKSRPTSLCVVGNGSMTDWVEQQRKQFNAPVKYLGAMDRDDLARELKRNCDVLACPSKPDFAEGRCMVLLEAMVLNIPVVAPNYGPFPFIVESGLTGVLFNKHNVANIQAALEEIGSQPGYSELCDSISRLREQYVCPPRLFSDAVNLALP